MNNIKEETLAGVKDKTPADDDLFLRKPRRANGDAGVELPDLLRRPTAKGSFAVTCVDYNADHVHDHMLVVFELVQSYHDFISTLTETYMSAVGNRMNEIMKTLAMISTIFVPLTFLAGVYGMNMPIPENEYWFSYPIFWIFSLALSVIMLRWFKHRGWF
jgi:CorA-like Mg2+ transporter protein